MARWVALGLLLAAASASPAHALSFFINDPNDAALTGSSLYDFNDQADNTLFTSTSVFGGAIDITLNSGGSLRFDNQYSVQFGTTGITLETRNVTGNDDFEFVFATSVTAFGFAVNALDIPWTLEIFDDSDVLIDTFTIPVQLPPGSNFRRGFAGAFSDVPIKRARVSNPGSHDFALIDDIQIVPEPGTGSMVWLGLLGLALAGSRRGRRRRKGSRTQRISRPLHR